MANRRMFSKTITNSSRFLMMPQSTQNLYFHLGMNADDDGFVEHFTIMRMTDSKPDDLSVLHSKGFVCVFDDKVLIIKDWKENNYIQADRYTQSKYLKEYKDMIEAITSEIKPVYTKCIQDGYTGKVRLGKVSLGKDNKKEFFSKNSSLIEELEYTEPPKETFDCKAKTYAKIGIKYTAPKRTDKQKEVWDTETLAKYIKEKALSTIAIDPYINKTKSSAHWKAISRIIKEFGLEEGKKMAEFYLNSPKCQEHGPGPTAMFSDDSINKYKMGQRKIKSFR